MPLIEARGVAVDYPAGPVWARRSFTALHPIDLTIEPGEIVGLVGESGSGKSTFGNALIGRIAPSRGAVLWQGKPLATLSRQARAGRFAAVLQHPKWSLNPMLRIGTSVAEPLQAAGRPTVTENKRKVAEALDSVGLPEDFATRFPHELSGGQRQRVSIARALITEPEFVLFDEAVSALDVSVQAQVLNMIRSLQRAKGFSAVFISHDLAATRYVTTRIAVLFAGRLMEETEASAFYEPARHPYSRGLQFASGLIADPSTELSLGQPDDGWKGCPLVARCPKAHEACMNLPTLFSHGRGRAACWSSG
jgi:ABC-type oligopeptide transport system ATPase subunit